MVYTIEIKDASSDLALEAIKSLPVIPDYVNSLFLSIKGLENLSEEKENIDLYLAQCEEKKVIPFSNEYFTFFNSYNPNVTLKSSLRIDNRYGSKSFNQSLQGIVKGYKPMNKGFEITGGFQFFKEKMLDSLVEQGYQIRSFDICLDSEYDGQCHRDTSSLEFDLKKSLNLSGEKNFLERNKLSEWFYSLILTKNSF